MQNQLLMQLVSWWTKEQSSENRICWFSDFITKCETQVFLFHPAAATGLWKQPTVLYCVYNGTVWSWDKI